LAAPFKRRTAATYRRDITLITRLRSALQLHHAMGGEGEAKADAEAAITLIDELVTVLIRMHRRAVREESGSEIAA